MSDIIIFDTETTGINTAEDQIIEISIQFGLESGSEIKTRRIKPTQPIHPAAEQVHGITMEDLKDCPSFSKIAKSLKVFFDKAEAIVGYNVRFDLEILQNEFKRAGVGEIDLNSKQIIDPLSIWRRHEPRDLASAHERFVGKKLKNHHAAEDDVKATAAVLQGMLKEFKLKKASYEDLAAFTYPPDWIGTSKHLQWQSGKAVFGFGKLFGKPIWDTVREDESYARWMLSADFPKHVGEVLESALEMEEEPFTEWLEGVFPQPASV